MRVRVLGSSLSAAAVRSSLHLAGVAVSDLGYGFTVEIVDTDNEHPTIDGVDCEFERKMVNRISDCANTPVLLLRPGGIRSDQHIRIGIPVRDDNSAIERGIMQAIVQAMTPPEAAPVPIQPPGTPAPKIGWWKAFRRWLAALIYATCLYGQITSPWPIIGSYTTTSLPSAGVRNRVAVVTNAASSSSCTSGGGSTVVLCRDTGLAWEPLGGGGGGGAVSSVFTRTGAVTAQSGDYTAAQVTNAVSTLGSYADPSWLTSIAGSKVSGSISGNASTATALASTLASGAILKGQGTGIPAASIMSESAITSTYDSTARTVAAITDGGLARVIKSRPSTESKRIVIYGSSVAAGSGASTYANSWAGIFSTAMTAKGYTVYNPSIGGNSTAALISRFWTDVAPVSPDFVILASGFPNDGYDQTTYLANMHRLIKMIESIGAIPVIFGQYGDNTVDATILRKKQEIYAYFDKTGLLIADMFGSVADPATGYWLPGVYTDSLHPNDTGHAIMAANIPYTWFDNALTARSAHRSKTASFLTLSNTSTTQSPILVTLDRPAPSWTVAGWFKDGGTVGRAYFGVTNSEGNAVRARNASGLIDFAGAPGVLISSSVNGQGGEWHHIAVTHQGNTKTNSLYVDGALIGTVVGGSTAVTATAFAFLGRSDTNTLNMIGGSIAMPLIYRAALTANDIKQIYSGSIPIRSLEWASSLSQLPTAGMIRNEADTSVSGIVASAADWTGPVPFITDRALGKAAAFGLAVYDQGTIGISQITVRPGANQSTNPTMAWLNSGGTTVSSVDSNGYGNFARLGVGITPTNALHVYSPAPSDTNAYLEGNGAYLKLNGRIGYSHVEFQNNGTATWKIGQEGVTKLQFFNAGVEKASMDTAGVFTAPGFVGPLTGNASTATALAANPSDCGINQFATTIAASGDLTCAQVAYSQVSGTPALAAVATSGSASDLGSGTLAAARGGAGTVNGLMKANGTGTVSAAVAGTDYVVPSGSISGNAATATALQTARNINGVAFDGTAPITITANLPSNPAACTPGDFVTDIAADGTLTCATPPGAGSGLTQAQVLARASLRF